MCDVRGGQGSGRKGMANLYRLSVPKSSAHFEGAVLTGEHPSSQLTSSLSLKGAQPSVEPQRTSLDINSSDYDSTAAEQWIEDQCDGLMGYEASTVEGMLSAGVHPRAIANRILADRRRAA